MPADQDPDRERERQATQRAKQERTVERERRLAESRMREKRIAQGKATAASHNEVIDVRVQALRTFLITNLEKTVKPSLISLRVVPTFPELELGALERPLTPPKWEDFSPAAAGWWRQQFAKGALALQLRDAETKFHLAKKRHDREEVRRQQQVTNRRAQYAAAVAKDKTEAKRHNGELDNLEKRVATRDGNAIETYLSKVLDLMPLPTRFPREHQIAFDVKAEHAVVEIELPSPLIIPVTSRVKYVQSRDETVETTRPVREQQELYRGVVSQLCLLAVRVLFNADAHIQQVSLNGRVRHIDPGTGQEQRPHVISLVVERAEFSNLVLERVDPSRCLKHLNALVSPNPFELEPVRPLVEFERSRLNFVDGLGVVSYLDARPDLMDMSPTEFEHLIAEIFTADDSVESIESLVTSQSNDGGVDGVIFTKQPLGRSMTVVQVKQYSRGRNLGPAHVRELIGSIHEVKASNGLLVTTSDFTATARRNAEEFGRMQLINGNNLVYLIKEHLKKDVLIGNRPRSHKSSSQEPNEGDQDGTG